VTDLQLIAVSHRSRYTKEQAMDSQLYPVSACRMKKILLKQLMKLAYNTYEDKNTMKNSGLKINVMQSLSEFLNCKKQS